MFFYFLILFIYTMSSYTSGALKYGLAASSSEMPLTLGPSTSARPIPSKTQLMTIASQSATQGPNGLVSWQINTGPGSGYLKSNSCYFRGRCNVTLAANNDAVTKFSLPSASASSLINRVTLTAGGTQLCQINDYHLLHECLLTHTTSKGYYENDNAIFQYAGQNIHADDVKAGGSANIDFVIPLILPPFCGEKSFPLFLLNAPLMLSIDLNSVANALFGTAAAVTSYTVSQAQFVYESIFVEQPLMESFKSALGAGNLYQLHVQDFLTLKTTGAASLNYQIGANLSSVLGVLYTHVKNAPAVDAATVLSAHGQTNFKLLLDGRQVNNFDLNNKAQIFAEMNRALSNMFDSNSVSNCTAANYLTDKFVGGVSCNRFNEMGMAMTGTPAQNINIQLTVADANPQNFNVYVVVMYNQIIAIDAVGGVTLVK
jgi:hypothetical protein